MTDDVKETEYMRGFRAGWDEAMRVRDATAERPIDLMMDLMLQCRCNWRGRQSQLTIGKTCPRCGAPFTAFAGTSEDMAKDHS